MVSDPFAPALCAQTVNLFQAMFSGIPDGACLSLDITPLGAMLSLAVLGLGVVALQVAVRRVFFGRSVSRHDAPETGLRQSGNHARAQPRYGPRRS